MTTPPPRTCSTTKPAGSTSVARAIMATLISLNEVDQGGMCPANVVDGQFAIARAIHRLADVLDQQHAAEPEHRT